MEAQLRSCLTSDLLSEAKSRESGTSDPSIPLHQLHAPLLTTADDFHEVDAIGIGAEGDFAAGGACGVHGAAAGEQSALHIEQPDLGFA